MGHSGLALGFTRPLTTHTRGSPGNAKIRVLPGPTYTIALANDQTNDKTNGSAKIA